MHWWRRCAPSLALTPYSPDDKVIHGLVSSTFLIGIQLVIDQRTYTLQIGAVHTFMELFEKEGLEPQVRILGNFMGLFRTEIGNINQIIMMFGYEDAGDRQRRRDRLYLDPAFQSYLMKVRPLLKEQEVRLLTPSKCNPPIGAPVLHV
jgi:hypothetical protein